MAEKKKRKKLGFITRVVLFFNLLAVLLLFGSYLAPYINPDFIWPIAFLGLSYIILLFINLLFVLLWLLRSSKYVFLSLIALALGWNHITNLIQINKEETHRADKVSLISYNVHHFSQIASDDFQSTMENITDRLKESEAEIVCLQECYLNKKLMPGRIEYLKRTSGYNWIRIQPYMNNRSYCTIILSKYPIIDHQALATEEDKKHYGHYADIKVLEDTLRVFNMHLQSIKLDRNEYVLNTDIGPDFYKDEEFKASSKRILSQIKNAFIKRGNQAVTISNHIEKTSYPIIVCGDMNDTPQSFAYRKISAGLEDSFRNKGNGTGRTYYDAYPSIRIDYILHSKDIQTNSHEVLDWGYSDHRPVKSVLSIN